MRILVIGGTRFLGRHFAHYALDRGHDVTLFHRGRTLPGGIAGTKNRIGDRTSDLATLDEPEFDAIVDTCGYLPRDVAASCAVLHLQNPDATYAFVSSVSAYRDGFAAGADESTPLCDNGDPHATEMTIEAYGPLKACCETTVLDRFGDRALIVRPGLLAGPHDPTDRFTYWVRRTGQGGALLAPGSPNRAVQFIDARDLAQWLVRSLEAQRTGIYNATGPLYPLTFGGFLRACRATLQSDAEFAWAPEPFLLERGVEPWSEMPLWVPQAEAGAWDAISSERAVAAGLIYRPLRETILDTWRWDLDRDRATPLRAGLSASNEARLLDELAQAV